MPAVKPGESHEDYLDRCIPYVINEGKAKNPGHAWQICNGLYKEHKKNMDPQEYLLEAIRTREKKSSFNTGILTADLYVKTIQDCVGSDLCYRYAAKGNISFQDILTKAAKTLTYNNEEMVLEDIYTKEMDLFDENLEKIILPKNTLMVFKHTLTSSKKDRDGDTLQTKGAKTDPKMLMLWNHVHTLPIGKYLGTSKHDHNKLSVMSAIVDINDLSHDSAVMVDNKMGRYSHGFKALDYEENKDASGKETGGFNIKSFEIMEESLVSVPANPDAETEEVILSLVSNNKLTSPLMKGYGKSIKERRPTSVPVAIDLKLLVNGKPVVQEGHDHGHEQTPAKTTKCNGKPDCGCGCSGTPKKTDGSAAEESETSNKEVKTENKMSEAPELKSKYGNYVQGSFEDIRSDLQATAVKFLQSHGKSEVVPAGSDVPRPYANIIATFPDEAVVCLYGKSMSDDKYFKISWEWKDGEAQFTGTPKEVSVETETKVYEKSVQTMRNKEGKVLNASNYGKLQIAQGHLANVKDSEHLMTRGGKAKVHEAHGLVSEVIATAGVQPDLTGGNTSTTHSVKEAKAAFLSQATFEERKSMIEVLQTLNKIEADEKKGIEFKAFVGS